MVKIVDTTVKHLIEFNNNIRPGDLEEIKAACKGKPFEETSIEDLRDCLTLIDEKTGDVLGIGAYDNKDKVDYIWLITTTKIETRKIEFLRFSKRFLRKLLAHAPKLYCAPFAKNQLHLDYIEWLGGKCLGEKRGFRIYVFNRLDMSNKRGT